MTIVTGPSFTSSTVIIAPKRPVCVATPRRRSSAANTSTSGAATSGRAAASKLGRLPLRTSARERELRDNQRLAAGVDQRAIETPPVIVEDAHLGALAGDPACAGLIVAICDAHQEEQPTADQGDRLGVNGNRGSGDALKNDAHGGRA